MESIGFILTNTKYRLFWHIVFWLIVLAYYTLFFGHQGGFYWFTLKFVSVLLPVAIATTYLFNYYLIPNFLFKRKFKTFVLLAFYTAVVSFYLISLIIFPFLILGKGDVNFAVLDKSFLDIYFLVVGLYAAVLIAILIKLLKYTYERQNQHLQLLKEKTAAELEMLRSQINPHFLFNTLNSIYALSLKKSEQAAEVVLKLSEMLDYLLYECREHRVQLKKEIGLIQNYLYLQKIKHSKRLHAVFEIDGEVSTQKIAPMLLLPFIENSFKHGVGKQRNNAWVNVNLKVNSDSLDFYVKNSQADGSQRKKFKSGGIGIINVRKRLDLMYKNNYSLNIQNNEKDYRVHLNLNKVE
ncbi:MAG: histidine kinase [Cytophagales bacterium]|nr:histidine kinase [Cytophagales bacterium]